MSKLLTPLLTASLLVAAPVLAGERCGPRTCDDGDTCCNDSCGICVPPNGACILPYCGWDRTGFQGHRPLVPFGWATPFAASSAGVQLGTRSDDDEYVTHVVDGRAQGTLALSRSWFLRADAGLQRSWFDEERGHREALAASAASPGLTLSAGGWDGLAHVELDGAWTVPTRLNWLQAALLLGPRYQARRHLVFDPLNLDAPRDLEWSGDMGWYLVPGAAVSAGNGWLALSGIAQAHLGIGEREYPAEDDRRWRAGAGLSLDLLRFGVPMQAMVAIDRQVTRRTSDPDPDPFDTRVTTATAGFSMGLQPWRMVVEAGHRMTTAEYSEGEEQTLAVRFEWLPQP
jgi:hypothetical protein